MRLAAGAALTLLVTGLAALIWDRQAAMSAATFGLVATGIQLGAARLLRGMREAPVSRFLARWGAGMALRLGGVVLLAVTAMLFPERFPALPAAVGFLGVLMPLLVLDLRAVR
jgi:hypothetical protein